MITAEKSYGTNNTAAFAFYGLSTDKKPTDTYEGVKIRNASTFFEMDTKAVKFYDDASDTWV